MRKLIGLIKSRFYRFMKCWHRLTASWRSLPDFVVIGAQRGGTTSLYKYLIQHPQVVWAYKKEVHYFDTHYREGLKWYLSHFPTRCYLAFNKILGRHLVVGEATPYYIFHPLAPQRLKQLLPQAKLIVILRNPIDRAYSQYQQCHQSGRDPLSFEEALEKEEDRLRGEAEKIRLGNYDLSFSHKNHSYKARGRYVEQLEYWFTLFPRQQLLILKAEDMYDNPQEVMRRVFAFIGVATDEADKIRYEKHHAGSYSHMNPETRKKLALYFKPYNQRLYELLGENFDWEVGEQIE